MRLWLAAVAAITLVAFVSGVSARERAMSLAELSDVSSAAVLARITGAHSVWIEMPGGKLPFIRYEGRTLRTLDGTAPESFYLHVPGLVSDTRIITSIDEPAFAVGQETVVFLQPAPAAGADRPAFRVTGSSSGVMAVSPAQKGHDRVVLVPAGSTHGPGRVAVKLPDLEKQLAAIRENRERAEANK